MENKRASKILDYRMKLNWKEQIQCKSFRSRPESRYAKATLAIFVTTDILTRLILTGT